MNKTGGIFDDACSDPSKNHLARGYQIEAGQTRGTLAKFSVMIGLHQDLWVN